MAPNSFEIQPQASPSARSISVTFTGSLTPANPRSVEDAIRRGIHQAVTDFVREQRPDPLLSEAAPHRQQLSVLGDILRIGPTPRTTVLDLGRHRQERVEAGGQFEIETDDPVRAVQWGALLFGQRGFVVLTNPNAPGLLQVRPLAQPLHARDFGGFTPAISTQPGHEGTAASAPASGATFVTDGANDPLIVSTAEGVRLYRTAAANAPADWNGQTIERRLADPATPGLSQRARAGAHEAKGSADHDGKFAPPSTQHMRGLLPIVQANAADRKQTPGSDPTLSPVLGPVGVGKHAQWLDEEQRRVNGPDTVMNPRYRWRPIAELLGRIVSGAEADPATYLATADWVAGLYLGSRDHIGSLSYRIDQELLLGLGLTAEDVAELDRIFTSTLLAPQDIPVQDFAVDYGSGVLRQVTERQANRIVRGLEAQRQAAIHAQARELLWGLLYGLGGAKRGSASANIVVPRAGAAYGPPRIATPRTGEIKDEIPPFAGLVPPPPIPPGTVADYRGKQRELYVARTNGGWRLARSGRIGEEGQLTDLKLRYGGPGRPSGAIDVDLLGPNGELGLVGGPAKGKNVGATIERVVDLKRAAAERGVDAVAFFTRDTPQQVLDLAIKHLGESNVRLFDDPPYREPPRSSLEPSR
ncbi:hypothetical protein ACIBCN_06140 [Nocardia sp. NPDC051052]|uniref:hypothetical protein n=1 Tax=Nocardia sp. NPDC051052 TaxID=3364322 RepID=UPI0037B1E85A